LRITRRLQRLLEYGQECIPAWEFRKKYHELLCNQQHVACNAPDPNAT
jgi:hypothetical protein